VTFELEPAARWVADYYPTETVVERQDGRLTVTLRARDDAWLQRLALGLAGLGRVVDPPHVAATVRAEALEVLTSYQRATD
jgi:proteasome accessory factor C